MMNLRKKFAIVGISKNTVLLAFSSLFSDIATEMLYPIIPVFLTQYLHAGGSIVGLVEGVATATQNIVQGFSGWLSDKTQRHKPIALIGYILAACAKPLMGLSTIWLEALGARFVDRLGTGIRSAPRDSLIAASTDEGNRGKAFGLEGIGDNLGASIGPLVAVLLLFVFQVDIHAIFYMAIIPGLLAVLMIFFVQERQVAFRAKETVSLHWRAFSPAYWRYIIVTAIFGIGNSSNAFLILQTRALGIPLINTIFIYTAYNLVAAIISYPAGAYSDKIGRKKVLLVSFFIFIITYLGFAVIRNVYALGGLFVMYGCYQGIFRTAGKALATDFVPPHLRASSIGWYSTTVGLSGLVASVVAGILWDRVGHTAVFFYGAFFALLGTGALSVFVTSSLPQRVKDQIK